MVVQIFALFREMLLPMSLSTRGERSGAHAESEIASIRVRDLLWQLPPQIMWKCEVDDFLHVLPCLSTYHIQPSSLNTQSAVIDHCSQLCKMDISREWKAHLREITHCTHTIFSMERNTRFCILQNGESLSVKLKISETLC